MDDLPAMALVGMSPPCSPAGGEAKYAPPKACSVLTCYNDLNESSNKQVFYIVGTAHVSKASCDDVRDVIRAVQPEVVLLELCGERRAMLVANACCDRPPSLADALAEWREGRANAFQALYGWYLGSVAAQLEVLPGEEFRVAVEEARALNAKVVLGDRPLQVTVARLWAALTLWDKASIVGSLLFMGLRMPSKEDLDAHLEGLKETDTLTAAIEEWSKEMPALARVLIEERDLFMAYMLRKLSHRATRVVAVVGAGHLPGIRACWEADICVQELMRMPEKRRTSGWPTVAVLGAAAGSVLVTVLLVRWRRR